MSFSIDVPFLTSHIYKKTFKNLKFKKIKNMYRDIDEKNSFIKFEQDPINLKGPKIIGNFYTRPNVPILTSLDAKNF